MLPNVPAMFEAHFGVPIVGAVLNTLNTRLDAEAVAFTLQHGEARVLLTDREFAGVVEAAAGQWSIGDEVLGWAEKAAPFGPMRWWTPRRTPRTTSRTSGR